MTTTADIADIARRLDRIIRAAQRLRPHLTDLETIGWEPTNTTPPPDQERVTTSGPSDHTPKPGDPRARRLLDHLDTITARAAADLTGAAAIMERLLEADRPISSPPTRGALVSRPDLDQAHQAQQRRRQRGEYTPARLIDQP